MASNAPSTTSSSSPRVTGHTSKENDFNSLEGSDTKIPFADVEKSGIEVTSPEAYESGASSSSNPFANPVVAAHYAELYEQSKYECRHEFDPSFTWTPQEERKLVWKLDWHACLWAVSQLCHAIHEG
jgi:hypothetical protein